MYDKHTVHILSKQVIPHANTEQCNCVCTISICLRTKVLFIAAHTTVYDEKYSLLHPIPPHPCLNGHLNSTSPEYAGEVLSKQCEVLFYGAMGTLYVDPLKPFQHITFMYQLMEQIARANHQLVLFKNDHMIDCVDGFWNDWLC